jgi:hypothetical protein
MGTAISLPHLQLLPTSTTSGLIHASRPVSQGTGAGTASISLHRARLCGHARTRSSAHKRARKEEPVRPRPGPHTRLRPTPGRGRTPHNRRHPSLFDHALLFVECGASRVQQSSGVPTRLVSVGWISLQRYRFFIWPRNCLHGQCVTIHLTTDGCLILHKLQELIFIAPELVNIISHDEHNVVAFAH